MGDADWEDTDKDTLESVNGVRLGLSASAQGHLNMMLAEPLLPQAAAKAGG